MTTPTGLRNGPLDPTPHPASDSTPGSSATPPTSSAEAVVHRPTLITRLRQLGRDSLYLLTGLPIALASFTVLVLGISIGAVLLPTLVGLPVVVLILFLARGFAALERWRVRWTVGGLTSPIYRTSTATGRSSGWSKPIRGWLEALRDAQSWLDLVHGSIVLAVAFTTWCVAVLWWAMVLLGLTFPLWSLVLPVPEPTQIGEYTLNPWLENVGGGLFALVTIYPVLRGCTIVQTSLAKVLLGARDGELRTRIDRLTSSRDSAAALEVEGLRRIERDLHDGPQQRLVRLDLDLAAAQRRAAEGDLEAVSALLAETRTQTAQTLAEIRALSRGIAPPLLADRGLGAALQELTGRSAIPTDLDLHLPEHSRYSAAIESCVYFTVSEALTNVAKHARASRARITIAAQSEIMTAEVADDGRGGAMTIPGHGLAGLIERANAVDGTLTVSSPEGGPTIVRLEVPCGS